MKKLFCSVDFFQHKPETSTTVQHSLGSPLLLALAFVIEMWVVFSLCFRFAIFLFGPRRFVYVFLYFFIILFRFNAAALRTTWPVHHPPQTESSSSIFWSQWIDWLCTSEQNNRYDPIRFEIHFSSSSHSRKRHATLTDDTTTTATSCEKN